MVVIRCDISLRRVGVSDTLGMDVEDPDTTLRVTAPRSAVTMLALTAENIHAHLRYARPEYVPDSPRPWGLPVLEQLLTYLKLPVLDTLDGDDDVVVSGYAWWNRFDVPHERTVYIVLEALAAAGCAVHLESRRGSTIHIYHSELGSGRLVYGVPF
jgi:hypothetical protein